MSNVSTRICAVDALEVGPVTFHDQPAFRSLPRHTFATQTVEIALDNGGTLQLVLHLSEGCNSLLAGDPVAIPRDISEEDVK
jgi:hypothetical protein